MYIHLLYTEIDDHTCYTLRLNDKRKLPTLLLVMSRIIDDLGGREDLETDVELADLLSPPVAFAQDQGVPPENQWLGTWDMAGKEPLEITHQCAS